MSDDSYTVRHFYPDTGGITTALVDGDIVKQVSKAEALAAAAAAAAAGD